jgi:FkbM family methyltransferase
MSLINANPFKYLFKNKKKIEDKKLIKNDIALPSIKYGDPNNDWVFYPNLINSKSRILSFGVGKNLSFEYELVSQFACKVDVFDPTPKSIDWFRKNNSVQSVVMYEYGVANADGFLEFMPPENPDHVSHTAVKGVYKTVPIQLKVQKLSTILENLQIQNVDILKMDIEGFEYPVIKDLITSGIRPVQILIEYHHRFHGFSFESTKISVDSLREYGYQVFYVSLNSQEISFIANEAVFACGFN